MSAAADVSALAIRCGRGAGALVRAVNPAPYGTQSKVSSDLANTLPPTRPARPLAYPCTPARKSQRVRAIQRRKFFVKFFFHVSPRPFTLTYAFIHIHHYKYMFSINTHVARSSNGSDGARRRRRDAPERADCSSRPNGKAIEDARGERGSEPGTPRRATRVHLPERAASSEWPPSPEPLPGGPRRAVAVYISDTRTFQLPVRHLSMVFAKTLRPQVPPRSSIIIRTPKACVARTPLQGDTHPTQIPPFPLHAYDGRGPLCSRPNDLPSFLLGLGRVY